MGDLLLHHCNIANAVIPHFPNTVFPQLELARSISFISLSGCGLFGGALLSRARSIDLRISKQSGGEASTGLEDCDEAISNHKLKLALNRVHYLTICIHQ